VENWITKRFDRGRAIACSLILARGKGDQRKRWNRQETEALSEALRGYEGEPKLSLSLTSAFLTALRTEEGQKGGRLPSGHRK